MAPISEEAPPLDRAFRKYADAGAYHWSDIGRHWIRHNAFTAERYRRVLGHLAGCRVERLLDVGCGDGALLWLAARRMPEAHLTGLDPNDAARTLARRMLAARGVPANIVADWHELADCRFDAAICAEVIEHVHDPEGLLARIHRVLRPGGLAVLTTPIRLTETPEDPNHRREWFPEEFRRLCDASGLHVEAHERVVPAASVEVYFWRPIVFARVPLFRVVCNVLSIYAGVNALTWLRMRPRLFMMQIVVLRKG